jgi:hypothetical protein
MQVRITDLNRRVIDAAVTAGEVVGGMLIRDAVTIVPTIPKAPPPLGGTLREVGRVVVSKDSDTSVAIDVLFDIPYAAPMHAGAWVTGPMAGVMVRNWSEPGSGPFWLSEKLRRFRVKYVQRATVEIAKGVGM